MADFINTVEIMGDEAVADSIIDRTITELRDNLITVIGDSAFRECAQLSDIAFPNVTIIKDSAFRGCTGLKAIASASFPNLKQLGGNTFHSCRYLKTVEMPNLISMSSNEFYDCYELSSVNMPKLEVLGGNSFRYCDIRALDAPKLTTIGGSCFVYCDVLTAVILRKSDSIVTLGDTYAFTGTPIASGTGYIYVPRALVDSYKTATNWSTYAAQIRAIEDYNLTCESVSFDVTELRFTDGTPRNLTATFNPEPPYDVDTITWITGNPFVAVVFDGKVHPISAGTTTITVKCGSCSATCTVTVSDGVVSTFNLLDDIGFNSGYVSEKGVVSASASDVHTDEFNIYPFEGKQIGVRLNGIAPTAANMSYHRICYYDENSSFIGYTNGESGTNVITTTVPDGAMYARVSANTSTGLAGITISCDGVVFGTVSYTGS